MPLLVSLGGGVLGPAGGGGLQIKLAACRDKQGGRGPLDSLGGGIVGFKLVLGGAVGVGVHGPQVLHVLGDLALAVIGNGGAWCGGWGWCHGGGGGIGLLGDDDGTDHRGE
jgi:hypothetical protein